MNSILNIIQKFPIFEKAPQKIGLTQFKKPPVEKKKEEPSIKHKEVKLSDLMRRSEL